MTLSNNWMIKGTYSSHGLELIMLTYEEVNKVNAVKISVHFFHVTCLCKIIIFLSPLFFKGWSKYSGWSNYFSRRSPILHAPLPKRTGKLWKYWISTASFIRSWMAWVTYTTAFRCSIRLRWASRSSARQLQSKVFNIVINISILKLTMRIMILPKDSMVLDRLQKKDFESLRSLRVIG